jgi:hypothetical protein
MAYFRQLILTLLAIGSVATFALSTCLAQKNESLAEWRARNIVPYELYEKVFGPPGVTENMARLTLPFEMTLAHSPSTKVATILVHKNSVPYFTKAFALLKQRNLTREASVLGGAYNFRKQRGTDRWNAHAWGLEIDIDPDNNQFRWGPRQFKMDIRVVEAFEEAGFYWRGRLGFDAMSFSLSFESVKEIARANGIKTD